MRCPARFARTRGLRARRAVAASCVALAGYASSAGAQVRAAPVGPPVELAQEDPQARACAATLDATACLLEAAWRAHPAVLDAARALYARDGTVLGLVPSHVMDGGYRGLLTVVPEAPAGRYARHLGWVLAALARHRAFLGSIAAQAPGRSLAYRAGPLRVRFYRTVERPTPAAYASPPWDISYNVAGRLNRDERTVDRTLFHELFHLNDAAHGDWSTRALRGTHAAIVARCGARTACLEPYAPYTTRVRGGTYYAFQPGNDVREYAAELAVRYYEEQAGHWRGPRFKCGPAENARAWSALVREFFGGVDRTPPCPR